MKMLLAGKKVLAVGCIFLTHFAQGAIFHERIEGTSEYKTHYLFLDEFSSASPLLLSKMTVMLPGSGFVFMGQPIPETKIPDIYLKEPVKVEKPVEIEKRDVAPEQPALPGALTHPVSGIESFKMAALYDRATIENVSRILKKYKSIPGGVTLEGTGKGLPMIQELRYNAETNSFLINNQLSFANPVSRLEMREIIDALQANDLIGVSLGTKSIVYGALEDGSLPCVYLKLADHFLGAIVFANHRWILHQAFPEGYRPQPNLVTGHFYTVYFNFSDFEFKTNGNMLEPASSRLSITLVPLTAQSDGMGGYLPDFTKIKEGVFPREYEDNILHIAENSTHYQADKRVHRVNQYGLAVAFVRSLKESGVSLEDLAGKL